MKNKIVFALFSLIAVLLIFFPYREPSSQLNSEFKSYPYGIFESGKIYNQIFKVDYNDFNILGFLPGLYGKDNQNGVLRVTLSNKEKIIFSKEISISDFIDCDMYYINFDKQKESSGVYYNLSFELIESDCDTQFTIFVTDDFNNNSKFNNENCSIVLFTRAMRNNYLLLWYLLVIINIYIIYIIVKRGDNINGIKNKK